MSTPGTPRRYAGAEDAPVGRPSPATSAVDALTIYIPFRSVRYTWEHPDRLLRCALDPSPIRSARCNSHPCDDLGGQAATSGLNGHGARAATSEPGLRNDRSNPVGLASGGIFGTFRAVSAEHLWPLSDGPRTATKGRYRRSGQRKARWSSYGSRTTRGERQSGVPNVAPPGSLESLESRVSTVSTASTETQAEAADSRNVPACSASSLCLTYLEPDDRGIQVYLYKQRQ